MEVVSIHQMTSFQHILDNSLNILPFEFEYQPHVYEWSVVSWIDSIDVEDKEKDSIEVDRWFVDNLELIDWMIRFDDSWEFEEWMENEW